MESPREEGIGPLKAAVFVILALAVILFVTQHFQRPGTREEEASPELEYSRYIRDIRGGQLELEEEARQIAEEHGFPTESIDEALIEGTKRVERMKSDMAMLSLKGFLKLTRSDVEDWLGDGAEEPRIRGYLRDGEKAEDECVVFYFPVSQENYEDAGIPDFSDETIEEAFRARRESGLELKYESYEISEVLRSVFVDNEVLDIGRYRVILEYALRAMNSGSHLVGIKEHYVRRSSSVGFGVGGAGKSFVKERKELRMTAVFLRGINGQENQY